MKQNKTNIITDMEIDKSTKDLISLCANEVVNTFDFNVNFSIDIEIVTNDIIKEINFEHREKDYATDVLSFPLVDFKNGKPLENLAFLIDPDTNLVPLGDMIISYDKILEQAVEYNHSKEREFAFLTVHSVLHLLGFDHETTEDDKALMRKKEKEILLKLGIGR